ncbi:hypothetical protein K5549_019365, partial [Capra hircus]
RENMGLRRQWSKKTTEPGVEAGVVFFIFLVLYLTASCEFFVMICAPQVLINHVDLGLTSHCCISPCFQLPGCCGDIGRQKNG